LLVGAALTFVLSFLLSLLMVLVPAG